MRTFLGCKCHLHCIIFLQIVLLVRHIKIFHNTSDDMSSGHLCQMTSRSWLVTHLSFCGCPPDSTWHDLMLLMVVGTCLMGQLVLALLHLFEQCSDTHQRESEQLSRHTLCFLRTDTKKTLNYSVHIIEIIICNEILIPSSCLHNLYNLP